MEISSYFGGHIKDYQNAKRMFPGKKKRHVSVSVHTYCGIGKHYWVTLHEEDNPIWDDKEKGWRICWDDVEARGSIVSDSFLSMVSAKGWIQEQIAEYFPEKTHVVDDVNLGGLTEEDEQKWLGTYKEGD